MRRFLASESGFTRIKTTCTRSGRARSVTSEAQQRALAAALRLDYDLHATSGTWLAMVVRKALSCVAPGTTPSKRKDPDSAVDGQIRRRVPGGVDAPPPDGRKRKPKAGAKPKKEKGSSSSSGEVGPSSFDAGDPAPPVVDLDPPPPHPWR
jgi:hypothetical protein